MFETPACYAIIAITHSLWNGCSKAYPIAVIATMGKIVQKEPKNSKQLTNPNSSHVVSAASMQNSHSFLNFPFGPFTNLSTDVTP